MTTNQLPSQLQSLLPPSTGGFKSVFPDSRPPARQDAPKRSFSPQQISNMPADFSLNSEIAQMVCNRFDLSKQARRNKWMIWNRCWDHYRGIYDASNKEPWQSKTFMPSTIKVVETIAANMYSSLMAPEMPAEWEAIQSENANSIENINELIAHDMKKSNFRTHFGSDFIRELCLLGTSVGKVGYVKEYQDVMVKQRLQDAMSMMLTQMGMNPGPTMERMAPKRMLTKDWATFQRRDLYDIYPEPYTFNMSPKHWIIEKSDITNSELVNGMQNTDPYFKLENITPQLLMSTPGTYAIHEDPEKQIIKRALNRIPVAMHYLDPDRPHELYEYWGPVPRGWLFPELQSDPIAKYENVPAWVWVVDRQYVVRKRLNPYRDGENPYIRGHYIRLPGEWYGVGVAEIMMGLQIEKNELRNTRIDNVNLMLNKIIAVLKDKVHDWDRLISEPGAIWVFKGIDDIKHAMMPVEFPDMTKDAYLASKEIDEEIQDTTSATNTVVGVGGQEGDSGGNTFRGQMLNQQNAAARPMLYARILELGGLSDAYWKYYQRIYQFKGYEEIAQMMGPQRFQQFQFIPPEQLEMMANLIPKGVMAVENKGIKLAQWAQFRQQFPNEVWVKWIEVAREELIDMGYPDPDKYIFSDQEMQIFIQQQQMMMASMPGGIGGQTPPSPAASGGPPGASIGSIQSRMASGQRSSPTGQPVAGNIPGRGVINGVRPALPSVGPGASPIDMVGRPLG